MNLQGNKPLDRHARLGKGFRGTRKRPPREPESDSITGHSAAAPYLFSTPALISVSLLLGYPVLYGIYESLFQAPYLGGPRTFVGGDNYVEMLTDARFWNSLSKSAIFVTGCVVLSLALGLVFAFALNRVAGSLRTLRAVTLAPYIISNVAAAVMFKIIFNSDFGLINRVLTFFGVDGLPWLSNPILAMVVVILAQVWTDLPLTILLLLGGLLSIDRSYLDAALVDGATGWKRARFLSIPLIAPQIAISTVWLSYSTLTGLGVILALTGGGPLRATDTLPMNMYDTAFISLEFHQALAIATFILVLNAVLSLLYIGVSRRYGEAL
jgi:ABC-type sugar transport system permease subunit